MKRKLLVCLLIAVLCVCAVSAVACESLPQNAVKITAENIEDWFDIHVGYEHDADDYYVVHLKAAFVPKFTLDACTVAVTYEHETEWDTTLPTRVVSGTHTLSLQANATTSQTVSGTHGNRKYDIKTQTNTISITNVEGYVIKAETQWQRPTYLEQNGTELSQKLANFQAALNSANAVTLNVTSKRYQVSVFGDSSTNTYSSELRVDNKTDNVCVINGKTGQGEGYFASGNGVVREVLLDGNISIFNDGSVDDARALKDQYAKNFVVHADGDSFGSVAKIDENRFIAKSTLNNVRYFSEGLSWGLGGFEKSQFDVATAYTFDDSGTKLAVEQKISLYRSLGETEKYEITATTTYEIEQQYLRLVDEYPTAAQDTAQQALDNFVPLEVNGTSEFTVPLSGSGETEQWFVMNFQHGLYAVTSTKYAVRLYQTDGTTRVDTHECNELNGLYLARMEFHYGDRPNQVAVQVTKADVETYPNYDNPTVVGADGKMQGTVECWGDAVVFQFKATEGLYTLSGNKEQNNLQLSFSLGENESWVNPMGGDKLLKLATGTYTVVVSTNNRNSESFDFDLTLARSAVQEQSYTLTDTAREITVLRYQSVCAGGLNGGAVATFTVTEDGDYQIVTTPENYMDGYVLLYDAAGEYVSKKYYGSDVYALKAGTYTVEYSLDGLDDNSLQQFVVTSHYEKVS